MEHFICTGGCGGVSDKPGACQDPNCPRHGQPLERCECGNMQNHSHAERKSDSADSDRDDKKDSA